MLMKWLDKLLGKNKRQPIKDKWCCIGFKNGYESAGERGHSYLVGLDSLGAPEFVIQVRSVAIGTEKLVQSATQLSLITEMRIVYCPSCGANLATWYGEHVKDLYRAELKLEALTGESRLVLDNPDGW